MLYVRKLIFQMLNAKNFKTFDENALMSNFSFEQPQVAIRRTTWLLLNKKCLYFEFYLVFYHIHGPFEQPQVAIRRTTWLILNKKCLYFEFYLVFYHIHGPLKCRLKEICQPLNSYVRYIDWPNIQNFQSQAKPKFCCLVVLLDSLTN